MNFQLQKESTRDKIKIRLPEAAQTFCYVTNLNYICQFLLFKNTVVHKIVLTFKLSPKTFHYQPEKLWTKSQRTHYLKNRHFKDQHQSFFGHKYFPPVNNKLKFLLRKHHRVVFPLNLIKARKVKEFFALAKVLALLQRYWSFPDNDKRFMF